MIDKNKQYKTRDGREVRIYATDGAGAYPVQGATRFSGGWELATWTDEGLNMASSKSVFDLIEVKPKHKVKVLFWMDGCGKKIDCAIEGDVDRGDDDIAIVEVEFEEGQGLWAAKGSGRGV